MPPPFVRPFHFWCQKVLPLVFDDSLSYYEVLAKMRDYLNEAIEEINGIGGEFEGVKTQLTQLKTYVDEYFAGLDVNQAISDKLDNMVESGEMDAVITPIFAAYANPLFAASVADMVATNFAYANYENNKIYTFNQSTGLYQTSGKEFGGVVSSVDEMEDNDKYYALDSDGMLYSYDFPQAAFVATGLTYGGYRYGVNAMRPIANTYVLTTNSHIYTWNGSEYVDTGVVYGLSNTAFIWRRKLTSADNVTTLIVDGWYSFNENDLPDGLPVNMSVSNGFVVVYSLPDGVEDSDNVATSSDNTVDTQRSERIRADSRNKRIVLKTRNGGSWFWNGENWLSENEIGFPLCEDCDAVTWNSVLVCGDNTANAPTTNSGIIKTFVADNEKAQMFFDDEECWFRKGIGAWNRVVRGNEQEQNVREISDIKAGLNFFYNYQYETRSLMLLALTAMEEKISSLENDLTTHAERGLLNQNGNRLTCEDNAEISGDIRVIKTDTTLSLNNVPADANAVGVKLQETNENVTLNRNSIENLRKEMQLGDETSREYAEAIFRNISTIVVSALMSENGLAISCENNDVIDVQTLAVKTDATLTQEYIPADAKATGEKINAVELNVESNANAIDSLKTLSAESAIQIAQLYDATTCVIESPLTAETGDIITSERLLVISSEKIGTKTDTTLSLENVAADAKAVGDIFAMMEQNQINPLDYTYSLGEANPLPMFTMPTLEFADDLPLSGTKHIDCKFTYGEYTRTPTIKNCNMEVKIQGSSSINYPKKNFNIKLPFGVKPFYTAGTNNGWTLKANAIDPSGVANLLSVMLWHNYTDRVLPRTSENATFSCENNDTITCENGNTIGYVKYLAFVRNADYMGVACGLPCLLMAKGKFHGSYTLQSRKGKKFFGVQYETNYFILQSQNFSFNVELTPDNFYVYFDVEENSDNNTVAVMCAKINALSQFLATVTEETTIDELNQHFDVDNVCAYVIQNALTNNTDGVTRNYMLCTVNGGETFSLLPYDCDQAFSCQLYPTAMTNFNSLTIASHSGNKLFNAVLTAAKSRIVSVFDSMVNNEYSNSALFSAIQYFAIRQKSVIQLLDHIKWATTPRTMAMSVGEILWWYSASLETKKAEIQLMR